MEKIEEKKNTASAGNRPRDQLNVPTTELPQMCKELARKTSPQSLHSSSTYHWTALNVQGISLKNVARALVVPTTELP